MQTGPPSRQPLDNLVSSQGQSAERSFYSKEPGVSGLNVSYVVEDSSSKTFSHVNSADSDTFGTVTVPTVPANKSEIVVYRSSSPIEPFTRGNDVSSDEVQNSKITVEYSDRSIEQVTSLEGDQYLKSPIVFDFPLDFSVNEESYVTGDNRVIVPENSRSLIFSSANLSVESRLFSAINWPKNSQTIVDLNKSKSYSGRVNSFMVSTETSSSEDAALTFYSPNMSAQIQKTDTKVLIDIDYDEHLNVRVSQNQSRGLKAVKALKNRPRGGLSEKIQILNATDLKDSSSSDLKRSFDIPPSYGFTLSGGGISKGEDPSGDTETFFKSSPIWVLSNNTVENPSVTVGVWQ